MTGTPPPVPSPASGPGAAFDRPARSPGMSWLVGCGVVLLILVLVAIGLIAWMFMAGGSRIEMARVVGPDAVAVVHLTDCSADEGVREFLAALSGIQGRLQAEQIPPGVPEPAAEWMRSWVRSQSTWDASQLPEAVVALEPGTDGTDRYLGAVAMDRFPRIYTLPFRFMVKQAGRSGSAISYRGQTMARTGDVVLTLFGSTVVGGNDTAVMTAAVDRVLDGPVPNALLDPLPPSYPDRWDAYGVLVNTGDRLGRWLGVVQAAAEETLEAEEGSDAEDVADAAGPWHGFPTERILTCQAGLDIRSAELAVVEVEVRCADAATAEEAIRRCEAWVAEARAARSDDPVDIRLATTRDEARATMRCTLTGLLGSLEEAIRAGMAPVPPEPDGVDPSG